MVSLKVARVLPPREMNSRSLFAEKITGVLEDFPVHRKGQTVEVTFKKLVIVGRHCESTSDFKVFSLKLEYPRRLRAILPLCLNKL